MASLTSMLTGLSGLATNAQRLDVIGNNIANVNTAAFKSNRALFAPTFNRTFSMGTGPNDVTGGTNPSQVGMGVMFAGTQRNFSNGAISATGVATDLAIEGDGFFIIRDAGERLYTRAGSFQRNSENDLVTLSGGKVLGYGIDDQFQIVDSNLVELNIPVGTMTLAQMTRNVLFNGNLNAAGTVATQGSTHTSASMYTDELDPSTFMTGAEDLTSGAVDLWIDDGMGGSLLAIEGGQNTIITISGIEKGGKDLGTFTFGFMDAVTAADRGVDGFGTSMNDFAAFLEDILGLNDTDIDGHDLGGSVTILPDGTIEITGNKGTVQELNIQSASFTATNDIDSGLSQPFILSQTDAADGESVRTSFVVYDSLGTAITVDLTFVLQATEDGQGTVWQFLAESADNDSLDRIVGTGIVRFDSNGRFISTTDDSITIERGNGATDPMDVTLRFDSGSDSITSLGDQSSNLASTFQDGSPIGTLSNFSIGGDGIITGFFTNGLTRAVGQVALAKFANAEGLVDVGNSMFRSGPNSGTELVTRPSEFGTGTLIGGALELSNVDLSQEFINMIMASTGYSASSRVISTTNELLQQLMVLGR